MARPISLVVRVSNPAASSRGPVSSWFATLIVLVSSVSGAAGQDALADVLRRGLESGSAPGAVCVVHTEGEDPIRAVAGHCALTPQPEPLRLDHVFDAASLTKCLATTTAVLLLVDRGQLRLDDFACKYLPEFQSHGKDRITIEHLLRHRAGLIPDNPLADYKEGQAVARERIMGLSLQYPPGEGYRYTDVGFIVLGWVVEAVTRKPLDQFCQEEIFQPCGMVDTRFFRPNEMTASQRSRCVPTEPASPDTPPLRGEVHDPRARLLGGVAGHAGLFTTAEDVRLYAAMLLRGGKAENGHRLLSPATVAAMTSHRHLPETVRRGLGVDLRLVQGRNPRGAHFPPDSFGHTGFTGTSFWVDPRTQTSVVLMTSRLYPDGKGNVGALRAQVADWVATHHLKLRPWPLRGTVKTGLDRVSAGEWPEAEKVWNIGLITNHTGVSSTGATAIDILTGLPAVRLKALFSPEHGVRGTADEAVSDSRDEKTGLPIFSLYGETRRPTPESLQGLDALVFDIQDIGCRFYTYVSTMVNAMEEAHRNGLAFVVLDRPNPIGSAVEGPIADASSLDFVGRLRVPVRHGMTVGELAQLAKADLGLDTLDLRIVACEGWVGHWYQDDTLIPWINPSPNMRSLGEALLYPGIGLLETTNISVGRGTHTPFEWIGAPWMNGATVARRLQALDPPGVRVREVAFTPNASKHAGIPCSGVGFEITDRDRLSPVALGVALATILAEEHGKDWETKSLDRLLKSQATTRGILAGLDPRTLSLRWSSDLQSFLHRRRPHLMYPRTPR